LTYTLLEKPIRYGHKKQMKAVVLFGIMLTVALLGYYGYKTNGYPWRPLNSETSDLSYKLNKEKISFFPCDQNLSERIKGAFCALSKKSPPPDIAIIGDSFSDDKFIGLANEDFSRTWMLVGKGGCPPVIGLAVSKGCSTEPEQIIDYVATKKSVEIVILSFFGNYFSDTPFNANHKKLN
jgi:hypothetical protein